MDEGAAVSKTREQKSRRNSIPRRGAERDGLRALTAEGVDAIVQAGTDLAVADLAGEAERWLGIPVIAINVATYWSALRINAVHDRVHGFGSLLAEH